MALSNNEKVGGPVQVFSDLCITLRQIDDHFPLSNDGGDLGAPQNPVAELRAAGLSEERIAETSMHVGPALQLVHEGELRDGIERVMIPKECPHARRCGTCIMTLLEESKQFSNGHLAVQN